MNTFLPYADFTLSARCLDMKRLGKQRIECWQIYQAIKKIYDNVVNGTSNKVPWGNHPAVLMWKDNPSALVLYSLKIIREWKARGYKDSIEYRFMSEPDFWLWSDMAWTCRIEMPKWFGNPELHAAYRSNLLRKDFKHYSQYGWTEPSDLAYVWPNKSRS